MWLDQLRDILEARLADAASGVLSVPEAHGEPALPVRYRSAGLRVTCLVPRWSELAEILHQPQPALLIVPTLPTPQCWIRYQGTAGPAQSSDWPRPWPKHLPERQATERWLVIALAPRRIDLFDERRGWGARETLDLARGDS